MKSDVCTHFMDLEPNDNAYSVRCIFQQVSCTIQHQKGLEELTKPKVGKFLRFIVKTTTGSIRTLERVGGPCIKQSPHFLFPPNLGGKSAIKHTFPTTSYHSFIECSSFAVSLPTRLFF